MSKGILHASSRERYYPVCLILPRSGRPCNHQGSDLVKNVLGLTESFVPEMFPALSRNTGKLGEVEGVGKANYAP